MGLLDYFKNTFGPVNYQAPTTPTPTPQYNLKDRNIQVNDGELDSIRPILYGEVSNRAPSKQALESNVILNTALNRVQAYKAKGVNKSLSQILSEPNQYQAYNGPQYKNYFNPPDAPSLNKKKQVDMIVDSIREQMKSGKFADNTNGAYYYTHNKDGSIKYDNLKKLFAS